MKRTLNLSASVLALVMSGAAYAQTDTTDTSSKAPATTGGIETVVVTAERRSENLMTTPISADVFSGGDLVNKGVLKVDDLQFISPSVTVNNFGQGIDFNIRGIGKGEHNTQTLTGVITYRDGVATFPGYVAEEPYYDIQSVQILRGPQGTFVGQNATGGAVFVTSNDPVIGGGYDGYVMASIGNYTDGQLQGAVNIPVTDTFALRIAGFGEARGSFYSITDNDPVDNCPGGKYAGCKPGYNPGDMRWAAGRISALWKPTESLTVSFKYDADYLDNGAYPSSPNYEGFKDLPYGSGNPNPYYSDIFHITANAPMQGIDRFTRAILKADYILPGGSTLRSITAYQYASTIYTTDLDGTDYGALNYVPPAKNWTFFDHVDETIYSQEINLISPDTDRFTWILGLFGQNDLYNFPFGQFDTGVPQGVLDSTLYGKNEQVALASFGQVGYKLTDDLQVQFGARYSFNRSTNNVVWDQYGAVANVHQYTRSFSLTYKGSINWQANENNFLYAFIATGYKPGGLNPPIYTAAFPPPFDPEKVTEYEAGWKATLLDGHLRTTVDGYYNRYRNFIVTVAYPLAALPISGFLTEVNVPNETKVYGLEAEADAVFGKLTLGAGLGLQHSALGTFFAVDSRQVGSSASIVCDPATGPANPILHCINLGGNPLTYAPSVSFNLSAQYQFDLDGGDTLTPRANFGYQSGQWATLFDRADLGDKLSPRNLLGAQLEWVHDDYVITAYGTNLANQHYEAALLYPLRFAGAPRQYGIRIMKVF